MKLYSPFLITTDIVGDLEFFKPYIDKLDWVDSHALYGKNLTKVTNGKLMKKLDIKHLNPEDYDMKMKKFVVGIFRSLGIKTQDFRSDFFRVGAGGNMPAHIDSKSSIAILIPLSKNTGALCATDGGVDVSITYQTLTLLNTQVMHWVDAPTEDRLLFRIAVHDMKFEDTGIYKKLVSEM